MAGMLKMAVNDTDEIYLGAMIYQIQSYGRIGLTKDVVISQVRVSGDLSHGFYTDCNKKTPNMWREYSISSQRR